MATTDERFRLSYGRLSEEKAREGRDLVGWKGAPWSVAAVIAVALAGPASGAGRPPAVAHDGPFGIAMGESLAELGPVQKIGAGYYKVLHPLRQNPIVANVWVFVYPSTGVCDIEAETVVNEDDPTAEAAMRQTDDLANSLGAKYGVTLKKVDNCDDRDGACDASLARKIYDHTAKYMYGWNFGAVHRPDHLGIVAVGVSVYSPISTAARLAYLSDRVAACETAEAAAGAAGL
jgi:hypothetical protein